MHMSILTIQKLICTQLKNRRKQKLETDEDSSTEQKTWQVCRAVQAGLLTPLTFARHRLSPLAAFTSGAYFLRNGSEFANFPLPTLKAFLEARSQNVSGNKQ